MRRAVAIGLVLAAGVAASGCATGAAGTPTYVTDISATINGQVATSEGGPVSYWVEYGTTESYDHESAHRSHLAPVKSSFTVSVPIAGLTAATTYHYRICAQDTRPNSGPGCGADAAVTTDTAGGRSGIVLSSNRGAPNLAELVAMGPDGSGPVNLTSSASVSEFSPAWSPDGRQLAYTFQHYDAQGDPVPPAPIFAMNADGSNQHPLTGTSNYHLYPAWSPDGKRIAFTGISGGFDIFVMDANGDHQRHLTTSGLDELLPAWSPDGTRIAYSAGSPVALADIYVMNADGTHQKALTTTPGFHETSAAWSPDGTKIAYVRGSGSVSTDIFVMNADGTNPVDITNSTGQEDAPTWSPDGSKIAFARDGEIYSIDATGGTPVNLTNNAFGDFDPAWSPRP